MSDDKQKLICAILLALIVSPFIYIGLHKRPAILNDAEMPTLHAIGEFITTEYDACVIDIDNHEFKGMKFQTVTVRNQQATSTGEVYLAFSPLPDPLKVDDRVQIRKYAYTEYDGSQQVIRIVQKKY